MNFDFFFRSTSSDNAPEFTAKAGRKWLAHTGGGPLSIEPGSPWENGYVESFIVKLRDELPDGEIFDTLLRAGQSRRRCITSLCYLIKGGTQVETSRERVIKALNHQEPDRIPLDLGGTDCSGIMGLAYNNLRNHLNLKQGRTQIFDVYQQIAKIEKVIRELLEIDTIPLLFEPIRWKASRLPDSSLCEIPEKWNSIKENDDLIVRNQQNNVIARMPQGGFYFEPVFTPLSKIEEPSQIENYLTYIESIDRPDYADESMDMIASRARKLYKKTDFAIIANLGLHLLTGGLTLRGYENFMMDLVSNKKLVHAILERLVDAHIKRCELYFDRVGQFIQVVQVNEDLGTQQGPMISIDCYKEMIWPYQKKLFQLYTDSFLETWYSRKFFIPLGRMVHKARDDHRSLH